MQGHVLNLVSVMQCLVDTYINGVIRYSQTIVLTVCLIFLVLVQYAVHNKNCCCIKN